MTDSLDAVLPIECVEAIVDRRPTLDPDAVREARSTLRDLERRGRDALMERIDRFQERFDSGATLLDRTDFAAARDRSSLSMVSFWRSRRRAAATRA